MNRLGQPQTLRVARVGHHREASSLGSRNHALECRASGESVVVAAL